MGLTIIPWAQRDNPCILTFLMLKFFPILIGANVKYKTKLKVKLGFAIGLHKKDIDL